MMKGFVLCNGAEKDEASWSWIY